MNRTEILDFIDKTGVGKKKISTFLKNHRPDILEDILSLTRFLDDTNYRKQKITFSERLYCIENNITSRPKCAECGDYTYFRTDERCYRTFCSTSCSRKSDITKDKRENTNLIRHGSRHYRNDDKIRKTRLSRYNGRWCPEDYNEKVRETCERRYGDRNYNNSDHTRKIFQDRYGVDYPFQSDEILKKTRDSFLANHPGMNCPMDDPEIRRIFNAGIRRRSWRFVENNKLVEPLFTENEYINSDSHTKLKFRCRKCGTEFYSIWDDGHADLCPKCHPGLNGTSESELEIYRFIKESLGEHWKVYNASDINRNIIKPREIDIVVCDESDRIRLLIEYDGLFFHANSDGKNGTKTKRYHIDKTTECESRGYQLIHIFENEWINNSDIVKSRILDILGIHKTTIYARKCIIKDVPCDEADMFLENNHLQGTCSSTKRYGLYYNDELVSLMTFGHPRFSKEDEWELLRFCNRTGYHIPGGASRLLRYFERVDLPGELISYADRRWSRGNMYTKLGFSFDHNSDPNYWYFKPSSPSRLMNRLRFQKKMLKNRLEVFDPERTEVQNMIDNGYLRIFDCGNMVFKKKYDYGKQN